MARVKITKEQWDKVKVLYEAGRHVKAIAGELNLGVWAVYKALRGGKVVRRGRIPKTEYPKIFDEIDKGLSTHEQVAFRYGVTRKRIWQIEQQEMDSQIDRLLARGRDLRKLATVPPRVAQVISYPGLKPVEVLCRTLPSVPAPDPALLISRNGQRRAPLRLGSFPPLLTEKRD